MLNVCTHFHLMKSPFADTVNPEFFFQTAEHERAYHRMKLCIQDGRALGLVWGPSGTGKTLLSQILLREISPAKHIPVVVLATPKMSKTALLREIVKELEMETEARTAEDLLDIIHQRIINEHHAGRRVVIFLDESHFLSAQALHMIRTLTNLETSEEKLVTVLLFAEESLRKRLRHASYDSLRGRISIQAYLAPLTPEETEQYVKFRLLVAGGDTTVFEPDTFKMLHERSRGIPREISKIADNALLEAAISAQDSVNESLVEMASERGL